MTESLCPHDRPANDCEWCEIGEYEQMQALVTTTDED